MAISNTPVPNSQSDNQDESDELNEHVHEPGDPDGVIAAEERQRWQEKHPMPPPTPRAEYKRKRRWPVFLIVVVLLAAVSCGAYVLGKHDADTKHNTAKKQTKVSQSVITNQTKNYNSTNYSLSFNYPANWTVNDNTTKLTVTSPAMELESAVGAKIKAHVIVTIQNQQTAIPGFPSGGAVAALGSNDISYTNPSSIQRAQTYLSYLSYTEPNGLDEVYVTGNKGYQPGQQIPMSDVVEGSPLINVGFESCQSSDCSTGSSDPVTLEASSWNKSPVNQEVTNLIESIVIDD